jgi:hypothetical protein
MAEPSVFLFGRMGRDLRKRAGGWGLGAEAFLLTFYRG